MISKEDLQKIDARVGKIIYVEDFPEARNASFKLQIDLGELGIKKSCVQLVKNYKKRELQNKLVVCIVNAQPEEVGPTTSEVIVLGVQDEVGHCILLEPNKGVEIGARLCK